MLVGSLKKDQEVLTKNVEGLTKAIDDAVIKVKVQHHQSWSFGRLFCLLFIRFAEFLELLLARVGLVDFHQVKPSF